METSNKDALAQKMDELGFGCSSLEELEEKAERNGTTLERYFASVGFLDPNEVKRFEAETTEDLTTQIEQVANGREYVARYIGLGITSNPRNAPTND